jgi:hypothetical protein
MAIFIWAIGDYSGLLYNLINMCMSQRKIFNMLFVLIALMSFVIRYFQSVNFDFPFTYDQALTIIDLRTMAHFYDFKILGPTTSITGLSVGPYYNFFLLPAYWLGMGNPQYLVIFSIIVYVAAGAIIYLFFYKKNALLGLLISSIFLMAPQLFPTTRYYWNANLAVVFDVLYFLAFWNFLEKKSSKNALIWGLSSALTIQFEAAFGAGCLVFASLWMLSTLNKKYILAFFVAVFPWFIPQIAYEVLNKFAMSNLLLEVFGGQRNIFGESLSLGEAASSHIRSILSNFEGQFMLPYNFGLYLLVFVGLISVSIKKQRQIFVGFLKFLIFVFLFYTAIYRHEIKPWYFYGIRVWYCFSVGLGLAGLFRFAGQKPFTKYAIYLPIVLFLFISFVKTITDQNSYVKDNGKSNDPKNASNTIKALDWIYEKAGGGGFVAYNYVPEILDLTDQYMYWWYGNKNYGYLPEKISYSRDPVPPYVREGDRFLQNAKPSLEGKVALKYERIGDFDIWLNQFNDFCTLEKEEFSWQVTVEWRELCDKN